MDFRLTSPATTRDAILALVPLETVKRSIRVTHTREDEMIKDDIVAAYEWLQEWLNGYFILQREIELYVSADSDTIEIPFRPVIDEAAVLFERRAADGTYADVDLTTFTVARQDQCVVIAKLSRAAFPTISAPSNLRAYRLTFLAGQPAAAVPKALIKSIVLLAGHWYANREAAFADPRSGNVSREILFGVTSLAGRYRFSPDHS